MNQQPQFQHKNSKGVTYYLHMKEVSLRGGKRMPIYYFNKEQGGPTAIVELPVEMEVRENPRNGFLTVVRKGSERQPYPRQGDEEDSDEDD